MIAPSAARRRLRNAGQRAQTLLRARLANGPMSGGEIEAEAETLDIPERCLRQVPPTPTA
jgi:hypothetical protein